MRAVFLDRDGVINRDSADYITRCDQFEFLPGSLAALGRLSRGGFALVVVTNQSAVGRGWLSVPELERMHAHLRQAAAGVGGRILDIRFCPHLPTDGCACRKPEPGLLQAAAGAHGLDLAASILVGDSRRDIECARRAGVGTAILVRTGNGEAAERELVALGTPADVVLEDLACAVDWIMVHRPPDLTAA